MAGFNVSEKAFDFLKGFTIDFDIIDKIIENVITVALRRFK